MLHQKSLRALFKYRCKKKGKNLCQTYLECLILASVAGALLQLLEPSAFQHRRPGVVASSKG